MSLKASFNGLAGSLLLAFASAAQAVMLSPKDVHDGDTVKIEGRSIRLWGIDAPELQQRCRKGAEEVKCGSEARKALIEIVLGHDVTCKLKDKDTRYDRDVSICYADKREINAEMVRRGWAVDYGQYSNGAYREQQRQAEAAKVGVWQYDGFQRPDKWRQAKRKGELADAVGDEAQDSDTPPQKSPRVKFGLCESNTPHQTGSFSGSFCAVLKSLGL